MTAKYFLYCCNSHKRGEPRWKWGRWWTHCWIWSRKANAAEAGAYKVSIKVNAHSRFATHLEEEQDQVWEHSSSPRLERSTQTGWCAPTQSSHHQRLATQLLSPTTPSCLSINFFRTPTHVIVLTTRLSTTSTSGHSSSPLQPTETSTILCPWSCPDAQPVSDSQVNSTQISGSSLLTCNHSHVSTSTSSVSHHSPAAAHKSTEHWPSQS